MMMVMRYYLLNEKGYVQSWEKRQNNLEDNPLLIMPCNPRCRKNCAARIEECTRININTCFWGLDFKGRRQFFDGHIIISEISGVTRKYTLRYTLPHMCVNNVFINTGITH